MTRKTARIIADDILGNDIPENERAGLQEWLSASPDNKDLYERIRNGEGTLRILELEDEGYGDRMAARYAAERSRMRRVRRRRIAVWSASAAVVVVAALGVFTWREDAAPVIGGDIRPGSGQAVLTSSDGMVWNLSETALSVDEEGNIVLADSTGLSFQGKSEATMALAYSTLFVPRGGEFFVTLTDGSQVWLNSETELRFPAKFDGAERRIHLKGEAFFDVAHDPAKPFVVSLADGDITVYGTRFNITDYGDAPLSAVLVEGSIGFEGADGRTAMLTPSQRMTYDRENAEITLETVNTSLYTSWIDNLFIFHGQRLDEIMATLARWYDLDVEFASDAARGVRLSGQLNRDQDITRLLNAYEKTGNVKFEIVGKHITVTAKDN